MQQQHFLSLPCSLSTQDSTLINDDYDSKTEEKPQKNHPNTNKTGSFNLNINPKYLKKTLLQKMGNITKVLIHYRWKRRRH